LLAATVFAAGLLVSPAASDPIPPAPPTITSSPSDPTKLTDASFGFTGETPILECSLDGADFAACTSPQSYSAVVEGTRNFRVRAVSLDGPSEPASYSWYIDLTPPTLPGGLSAEATSADGAVVAFAPTDDHELADFNCEPASGMAFAIGTTNVACTAEDMAGNSVTGDFDVTVADTTPPAIPQHADQFAEQDFGGGAHVTYDPEVTAQDAVDETPAITCDPESGSEFLLEPQPSSTVSCTATDASGNTSSPMQFTVTVQEGPVPEAPLIAVKPPALTNSTSAHFEFSTTGDISSVGCRLYDPNDPDGPFADCTATQDYAGLAEGSQLFEVRVMNAIGNVNEASYDWTVDLTEPGPATGLRARARPGSVVLRWVRPVDGDFDRVRIERQRVGAATWKRIAKSSASSYTDRGLVNEVRYRYRVVSIDTAGNVSEPAFTTARPSRVFTPQYGATLRPPVLIDWTSVRNATYFNLQLWRNGRKVLTVWPSRSRYSIPARWSFNGKRYFLGREHYVVYVWPGFGPKAAARYGRLLGSTKFIGR
jgi:hypothetical protein